MIVSFRQPVLVDEGNEPEDFWEALGGKGEYITTKRLEVCIAYQHDLAT